MTSQVETGVFQTIETVNKDKLIIRDKLYGEHIITEPVLIDLLQSVELSRLKGVCQHGVTALLGFGPRVTRFEHSVGAFLLVRKVGASVEEQVAALLHDISHTSLSHVVDYALSQPGEDSYHEVHKSRYLKTTQLPEILTRHGFGDLKALDEELFPLVEQPSPHLCADRLDYSLRDALAFDKFSLKYIQEVFHSLKAVPHSTSPNRILALEDPQLALALARSYLATDRDVWSNRSHANIYKRTGRVIKELVQSGRVKEEALWKLSDEDFWALLRREAPPEILRELDKLETEGLPDENTLQLPRETKIRTLDPDICQEAQAEPLPLSVVLPEWAAERQQYIVSRESTRE
ncbi:phosphoribosyl-aminoimidazole-succinocarboxamide synthase [Penicillium brasilianum]|uniref:Phosphoribosyl-aminoimidazole-succinocarboxamide synthase n=1 Tax=Penicillium brasilianum TaxID=104259 RepID=A0A1S9REX8_PENBI|nr:phosphoribosyl-aminoimidazole-succinocarboxamide synthase [Penicillium brasilianum]